MLARRQTRCSSAFLHSPKPTAAGEKGSGAVFTLGTGESNSVGGDVDFVRDTRATALFYLSAKSPKLPKVWQIRSETSLNNMPFHPQLYCNVLIFTYEVA